MGNANYPNTTGLQLSPARVAGILLGVGLVAVASELALRTWGASQTSAAGTTMTAAASMMTLEAGNPLHPQRGIFLLDEELGVRPAPGGSVYDERGVLHNEYALEKDPDRERVLFLGDSVVRRGTLVASIREAFGEERYEWWNAGVSAYSTIQEVGYYRNHLADIDADHVVLVFNWTDYEVTPLIHLDANGDLQVVNARRTGLNPWLLRRSHLYRYYVGHLLGEPPAGGADLSLIRTAEEKLAELALLTQERGATLTVLITPPMRSEEIWPKAAKRNHIRTLATLADLGVECFDAKQELDDLVASGGPLGEPAGDLMHPSKEFCDRFAARLKREGFLSGTLD